ncbi:arrestin domain-containing protein 1-like [Acanthaster planci]|uniref:Arrestin domain-containing protein 1-like n=1 Tax=Acanthaster planci TaxID=133434 RepID=A0A8B7Z4M3_ACAPL|nr:arrestin domain-containing protein 1-like [Acanthaster planci]
MSKPSLCIFFDKVGAVYSRDDIISGKVKVKVGNQGLENIKGVWIQFTCTAWVKISSSYDNEDHEQRHQYLNSTLCVFGARKSESAKPGLTLSAGDHSFPFKFRLPNDKPLPAPFEGVHGYVRYRAKATLCINRVILNKEHSTERAFSMHGPTVDLNSMPRLNLKAPVSCRTDVRNLFGLGMTTGTDVTFCLPKRGYIPGENVIVTGHVNNASGKEQRNIEVALIQETTYRVKEFLVDATNVHNRRLSRSFGSVACPQGKVTPFRMKALHIPPSVPASGMPGCQMINVQYYVKCNTSGCIETLFRLTVGTVPLRDVAAPAVPPAVDAIPSAPQLDKANTGAHQIPCPPVVNGLASRFDDAPPTYEEAIGSRTTLTNGVKH